MSPLFTVGANINIFAITAENNCIAFGVGIARHFTRSSNTYSLILVAALSSALLGATNGSVAVIYRTNDRMIVAADGLVSGSTTGYSAFCKIQRQSGWIFTATGIYGSPPNDIFTIASNVIRNKKTIDSMDSILQQIGDLFRPLEEANMLRELDTDRATFDRYMEPDNVVINFAIAAMSDRGPVVSYWGYKGLWDGKRSVTLKAINPSPTDLADAGLFRIGQHDAIDTFLLLHPAFITVSLLPNDIKDLIQREIDADRNRRVGHPIDVLVIGKDGKHEWFDRETTSVCPTD